ncbi:hypothetical protein [Nocardioides acrostichi]|uniref:PH domain-containing protein n=1 Tax=Nocardioides acrostichi TaxID=2784339 RepID=A0A930YCU5_9ACTN|nr:hypothetical protein [Nocardioides acrostichi]MBF4161799.1 hypothetical protein [Nocardioides acrostichi]
MRGPQPQDGITRFAPTSGRVTGILGLLICAVTIVAALVGERTVTSFAFAAGCLLAAALVWTTLLRPRLWVEHGVLVLRNPFSTVRIPLAAIRSVVVRQVFAAHVGGDRYVNASIGRSRQKAVMGSSAALQQVRGGLWGGALGGDRMWGSGSDEGGLEFATYVEEELGRQIDADLRARGIRARSPEQAALAEQVARERAWPSVAAVVVPALALVVLLLLR